MRWIENLVDDSSSQTSMDDEPGPSTSSQPAEKKEKKIRKRKDGWFTTFVWNYNFLYILIRAHCFYKWLQLYRIRKMIAFYIFTSSLWLPLIKKIHQLFLVPIFLSPKIRWILQMMVIVNWRKIQIARNTHENKIHFGNISTHILGYSVEWFSEWIRTFPSSYLVTQPRRFPYLPQLGDKVAYFRQGHEFYLELVERNQIYGIPPKMKRALE